MAASEAFNVGFCFSFYPEASYRDRSLPPYEVRDFVVKPRKGQVVTMPFVRWYMTCVVSKHSKAFRRRVEQLNRYDWYRGDDDETYDIDFVFARGSNYDVHVVLENDDDVPPANPVPKAAVVDAVPSKPAPQAVAGGASSVPKAAAVPIPVVPKATAAAAAAVVSEDRTGRNHLRSIILECKGDVQGVIERVIASIASTEMSEIYSEKLLAVIATEAPSSQLIARLLSVQ